MHLDAIHSCDCPSYNIVQIFGDLASGEIRLFSLPLFYPLHLLDAAVGYSFVTTLIYIS